jgi:hypothetical protein
MPTCPLPSYSVHPQQIASMADFSASQAWDNVKVSAGRDFNNFTINGSGDVTERTERSMDHSHDLVSAASDDGMPCRKATGNHGTRQLDLTIKLQSSARERILKVH